MNIGNSEVKGGRGSACRLDGVNGRKRGTSVIRSAMKMKRKYMTLETIFLLILLSLIE